MCPITDGKERGTSTFSTNPRARALASRAREAELLQRRALALAPRRVDPPHNGATAMSAANCIAVCWSPGGAAVSSQGGSPWTSAQRFLSPGRANVTFAFQDCRSYSVPVQGLAPLAIDCRPSGARTRRGLPRQGLSLVFPSAPTRRVLD